MAVLKYGLDKDVLKNTVIANKSKLTFKVKYTKITKEVVKEDDLAVEM